MSLPVMIRLQATTQAVGTPQHGAELRNIWKVARTAGTAFRSPPVLAADWDQCETANWHFAVQVRSGSQATHLQVFRPQPDSRIEVGPDMEPHLVEDRKAPYGGLRTCGDVLRDVAKATQQWLDALETGIVQLPSITPEADAILHHLTGGQYSAWYLATARQQTQAQMAEIAREAQRPLRVPRRDVQAVGPRIRDALASR